MTEKEHSVAMCELAVRTQATVVRDAKVELEEGYKKYKAKLELNYAYLKSNLEREQINLEEAKANLDLAKEELAKKFD